MENNKFLLLWFSPEVDQWVSCISDDQTRFILSRKEAVELKKELSKMYPENEYIIVKKVKKND